MNNHGWEDPETEFAPAAEKKCLCGCAGYGCSLRHYDDKCSPTPVAPAAKDEQGDGGWWEKSIVPCMNYKGGFDAAKLEQAIRTLLQSREAAAYQAGMEAGGEAVVKALKRVYGPFPCPEKECESGYWQGRTHIHTGQETMPMMTAAQACLDEMKKGK